MGPSRKRPTERLPISQAGAPRRDAAPACRAPRSAAGSRRSSRSRVGARPSRSCGMPGWRIRVRSSTGSVEASAAPRMAAGGPGEAEQRPGGERDERGREQRARAPRMSAASRRCWRSSPMSTPMASLNSTSTRPSVAITCSAGESSVSSTSPSRPGPSSAPTSRKIATCGRPVRSTAPERSDETMMTIPISARTAVKLSWVMSDKYTRAMPTSEPFATALLLTIAGILHGGQRAVQPGVEPDRRADRAPVPRDRHAGGLRGARRDRRSRTTGSRSGSGRWRWRSSCSTAGSTPRSRRSGAPGRRRGCSRRSASRSRRC